MNMIVNPKERLVLVGNGMAGIRAIEEILARAPGRFAITVFGAEPHGNYNRIMLSPVLSREKKFESIITHDLAWYEEQGIELISGEAVVEIDRINQTVTSAAGTSRGYDVLLLATGSMPFLLPVEGNDLHGVVGFRDLADVEKMLKIAGAKRHAVVIGGGLLGLEAANGLMLNGMDVTVIHLPPTLMERQLDREASELLQRDLTARGLACITGANTAALIGNSQDEVIALRLKDGREFPADLVVMAVGIRPSITLGKHAGLDCNRGILVDDGMRTSDPLIWAVGECIEHRGVCYGLVAPLFDMAKICADRITGVAASNYIPAESPTRLKVTGIDMFSVGAFDGGEGCEDIIMRDSSRGQYRRVVVKENRVVGVLLYGDAADGAWYFDLMKQKTDIAPIRGGLIFGPAFAADGTASGADIGAMADDAEVCGCNGVCKGKIVGAIKEFGLSTLDEVRARTKASASCGSCTGQVEKILAYAAGDAYKAGPKIKPMCKCTTHGHDAVRAEIRARKLMSIPAVMRALNWKTTDGCASCRPALNYYLLCEWPGEYQDDFQSRFVNERMHANIQKDGTYSVVPRMWGGVTNAAELRAIADVVERYDIPSVKVTGGQRIDLLGVRKEQLPDVWRDLNDAGMISGAAYAKGLRTVKTCVGSEWCRFGTQDSTSMGIGLEKMTWGSSTPAKVKMAVSGCPRNCAESSIKDFGVIATESGWDLLVGGNGGVKLRETELLAKVATAGEVLEYAAAFMQLYREEARYLERTAHWIERVGVAYVQSRLLPDAAARKNLHDRFLISQKFAQIDPWAERARQGVQAHEFRPLALVE